MTMLADFGSNVAAVLPHPRHASPGRVAPSPDFFLNVRLGPLLAVSVCDDVKQLKTLAPQKGLLMLEVRTAQAPCFSRRVGPWRACATARPGHARVLLNRAAVPFGRAWLV